MFAIGLCTDEEYLLPSLVVLTSLADALTAADRQAAAIRVLTTNLTAKHAATLAASARRLGYGSIDIAWDNPARAWPIVGAKYISATTYLRFHYTEAFLGRPYLAYLDSDILVLADPTRPLHHLDEHEVGLVRDTLNHTIGRGDALPGLVARRPDHRGQPYYNAGMMWCHTAVLPDLRRGITDVMATDSAHIYFNDQDALNLWGLRTRALRSVDGVYNTFELDRFRQIGNWVDRAARPPSTQPPAIIHFIGPDKPWHTTCPTTPAVSLYRAYLRRARRVAELTGDLSLRVTSQAPA